MADADFLAPLDTPISSPAAAPAEAAVQDTAPAEVNAPEAVKPRRGGCLKVVLALIVVLMLVGGAAGGAWWFLKGNSTGGPETASSGPSQAEPAGPPPPVEMTLAVPAPDVAAGAQLASRAERIASLVSAYETELVAATGAAPSDLIVAASGRQTADSVSEIPRHERWEIQFPPGNTIESYTRQLDYFKIEVGAIGGSDQVEYLVNLAEPIPTVRKAPAAAEKRLYLIWQRGSMREADLQLASRARLATAGKIFAHFCPEQLENDLAQLEDAFARQKSIQRVRKTIFGIKANDFGGFQFHVIDQKADGQ